MPQTTLNILKTLTRFASELLDPKKASSRFLLEDLENILEYIDTYSSNPASNAIISHSLIWTDYYALMQEVGCYKSIELIENYFLKNKTGREDQQKFWAMIKKFNQIPDRPEYWERKITYGFKENELINVIDIKDYFIVSKIKNRLSPQQIVFYLTFNIEINKNFNPETDSLAEIQSNPAELPVTRFLFQQVIRGHWNALLEDIFKENIAANDCDFDPKTHFLFVSWCMVSDNYHAFEKIIGLLFTTVATIENPILQMEKRDIEFRIQSGISHIRAENTESTGTLLELIAGYSSKNNKFLAIFLEKIFPKSMPFFDDFVGFSCSEGRIKSCDDMIKYLKQAETNVVQSPALEENFRSLRLV